MQIGIRSILLFLLIGGCVSEPTVSLSEQDLAAAKAAIRERFDREASLMEPASVSSEDGFFQSTVGARVAGNVKQDDAGYRLEFDFGASSPATCLIAREEIDLASWMLFSSTHFFKSLGTSLAGGQQLPSTDAGAIDGIPFLGVTWILGSSFEDFARFTQVKFLAANKNGAAITCIHNEAGYNRSFHRVFEDLISNLAVNRDSPPAAFYHEIHRFSIAGHRVGVRSTRFSHAPDGNIEILTRSSMIFPVDPTTIHASDTTEIAAVRPDGTLFSGSHLSVHNGELSTELELEPDAKEGWLVSGTFHSKPIRAVFSDPEIVSALGQIQIIQQALRAEGTGATRSFPMWVADADPRRTVVGTFHALERASEKAFFFEFNIGPIVKRGIADISGSIQSADIEMGPAKIHLERIHQAGEI